MPDMKKAASLNGIDFLLYMPSIFSLYADVYSESERPLYVKRFIHKIRMALQLFMGGYKVYYMSVGGTIVGHLVVTPGGGRVVQSSKNDIVIGPIWVAPNHRKKGYASKGIAAVLHGLDLQYKNAFEFIAPTNTPSIRSAEKNGFVIQGKAKESGLLRKISLDENGEWLLYRYDLKEK